MAQDDFDLNQIDTDIDVFRDSVLAHLANKNEDGLRQDADAVMAPIFVEKFIDDIEPGNPWNDVLSLMASKLMAVSPELGYLMESLDSKRHLVTRPGADLDDLVVVETTEQGLSLRLRD